MTIQRLLAAVMCGLIFIMLGNLAAAHHAAAGYERGGQDKVHQLEGTVVEWRWRNPHVVLVWDVPDTKGKVVRWSGELASPTSMIARGHMTRASLKAGDRIVVYAFTALRGTPQSIPVRIVKDGKVLLNDNVRGGGTVFEK
jgi:hypothetical protein